MSDNSNYNNGVSNYKGIQSFGTPSAFDPSRISRANSLNKQTSGSPFRLIDVNVSLVDSKTNDIFVLSEPLPVGSVIQVVSMHGHNTFQTVGFNIKLKLYRPPTSTPSAFPTDEIVTLLRGTYNDINNGLTNPPIDIDITLPYTIQYTASTSVDPSVPIVSVPTYIVLEIYESAGGLGVVNIKVVIFSPN